MAVHGVKGLIGSLVAGSLMFSSSIAMAAPTSVPQADPWAVLSAMSGGAPAAAMCGSAAAAAATAQVPAGCVLPVVDAPPVVAEAAPPPPLPVAVASEGIGVSPILIGLLAVAAGVGIYFAVRGNHNHANSPA